MVGNSSKVRICIYAAGVTSRGEIVFCLFRRHATEVSLYTCYYNLEKNTLVKVRDEVPPFESLIGCLIM